MFYKARRHGVTSTMTTLITSTCATKREVNVTMVSLAVGQSSGNNNDKKKQLEVKDVGKQERGIFVWRDIVEEVNKRKASGKKAGLFSDTDQEYEIVYIEAKKKQLSKRRLPAYGLGAKYSSIYFTKREAECMVWFLRGKTVKGVAEILKLSSRTVEYYLKNMKNKIGCRTKFELVDLVHASEFIKHINF